MLLPFHGCGGGLIVHPVLCPQSLIHASGRYGGDPALADGTTNVWAARPTTINASSVRFMTSEVSGNEPARLDPAVWGTLRRSSSIQRYAPPGERSQPIRKPQSRTPEELGVPSLIT